MDDEDSYTGRIVADVAAAADSDGRLPLPDMAEWDIFPFDGEFRVKPLEAAVVPEPPREGDPGGAPCRACPKPDSDYIWTNETWRLQLPAKPWGLPAVLLLEPRGHYDLEDLPTELLIEMGPLLQRVGSAVMSLGGIARVHVDRVGDGARHLHWWFMARPEGLLQLRGSTIDLWADTLPPRPLEEWQETGRRVAAALDATS
jgi:diadenosine tetraphosphate (Ap4A) HIT family hydrolase